MSCPSGEMIFWSSSEVPELGFALQDYLTPSDVSRFIKEKVVMDAARTTCTVPPIFKDAQGAMLQFIGYGEELNLAHPPRPADPKAPWHPIWTAKARLKSTGMAPLMALDDEGERAGRAKTKKNRTSGGEGESSERKSDDTEQDKGIGSRIKGLFGF